MIAMTITASQWIRFFGSNTRILLSRQPISTTKPWGSHPPADEPFPRSTSPQRSED